MLLIDIVKIGDNNISPHFVLEKRYLKGIKRRFTWNTVNWKYEYRLFRKHPAGANHVRASISRVSRETVASSRADTAQLANRRIKRFYANPGHVSRETCANK